MKRKSIYRVTALTLAASMLTVYSASEMPQLIASPVYAVETADAAASTSRTDAFLASATGLVRSKIYTGADDSTFRVKGRTYHQGVVMGEKSYNDNSEITFDVTGINTVSFDLGHVDNSSSDLTEFTIYLDGVVADIFTLTQNEPIKKYSIDVSEASAMKIFRNGDMSMYALANISVDGEAVPAYDVPSYKSSDILASSIYDNFRTSVYNGSDPEGAFRMQGKTFKNGIILGDGSYNDGSAFSLNVENVKTISFTLGHVDNSALAEDTFSIYLDNVLEDEFKLSPDEKLITYTLDVSNASTLRISKLEDESKYGLGDISFDGITPENKFTSPDYKTSAAFVKDIYNSYRCSVFDGFSTAYSFNMNGRTYYQGIVIGDGSYNDNASFALNVDNLKTVSFDLGHVDNSALDTCTFYLYLDNELHEKLTLNPHEPTIEKYTVDVSDASVLRVFRDNDEAKYALGDITTEKLAPKNPQTLQKRSNSAVFISSAYNPVRTASYDGVSSAISFNMRGRTYHQGIILGSGNNSDFSSVSFNVEDINTFSFDLGRIDNTDLRDATISIYLDNKLDREIPVKAFEPIRDIKVDVSKAKTIRIANSQSYARIALGDIIADTITPKKPKSVPEYTEAKEFIGSGFDSARTTFYTDLDRFTTFTMRDKEYTLGFILGDGSSSKDTRTSFNVENINSVSFSFDVVGEKVNENEKLFIYKDGILDQEIALTAENIASSNKVTIDTSDCSIIMLKKDQGYTRYGFVDFMFNVPVDKPAVTTPAVTTPAPIETTAPKVTTAAPKPVTSAPAGTTAPKVTTAAPKPVTSAPAVTTAPKVTTAAPKPVTSAPAVTTAPKVTTVAPKPVTSAPAVTTAPKVTTVAPAPAPIEPGDINGDGKISTSDVRYILQHIVGSIKLSDAQKKLADCNKDDVISTVDALYTLRTAIGASDVE